MNPAKRLLLRIESLRKKMTDVALEQGFTSDEVISLSQELDMLLNQYSELKADKDDR